MLEQSLEQSVEQSLEQPTVVGVASAGGAAGYTRQNALAEGAQIRLEGNLAAVVRATYPYPLYLTRAVFDLLDRAVQNPYALNDWESLLHDLMWMSKYSVIEQGSDFIRFTALITGTGREDTHELLLQLGPTDVDTPAPALTLMLPGEVD
jgi:hypothetical protein